MMSVKELRRVHVIRQALEHQITQVEAGTLLGLTDRQIRRLMRRVEQKGDRGLAHRGRGKPSNRRIPETVKAKVLTLYEQRYGDFGPTLAAEKLAERHGITLSVETLRGWLLEKGVDHFRRRKRPHRAWRARKAHVGELIQLDGSHHDWLEGRGPRCVLMAYIDDASSRVCARFYDYEGTIPAMDSVQCYIRQHGIPLAVYADQHTTYQSPAQPTVEEQLAGVKPTSQFGRALGELGVELIPAHSPQAKGRVERLFKTVQDRLVKEMRLAGIATIEAANRFLEDYLPIYNQRFSVQPAQAADLHRPRPAHRELDGILCLKTTRCLRKDFTIAHQGRLYQIHDTLRATHVLVEDRVDGTMRITHHGRTLGFHAITSRPVKAAEVKKVHPPRLPVTPRPDHPWRKRFRPERTTQAAACVT
ncbi:MAG: ISNCY family transposase [Nitrospirae bacterium]|nr:ISNCY family transposase [Nitrospirota bacterium]